MAIPARIFIWANLFMATFNCFVFRIFFSSAIIAMIKHPGKKEEDHGPRYEWSTTAESSMLSAYFVGYQIMSLFAGTLAERFGARYVNGITQILSAIFNALIPIAAKSVYATYFLRVMTGIMNGTAFPCVQNLIGKWAPPNEKSKFVFSLMGGTFSAIVVNILTGYFITWAGWQGTYYIWSIFVVVWAAIWMLTVSNSPSESPFIGEEELKYIEEAQGTTVKKEKMWPPYKSIFLSLTFWCLVIAHFGNLNGFYGMIVASNKFLKEVFDFNLKKAGVLSALPHLARMVVGIIGSILADSLRRREIFSTTVLRKLFTITSHIIPGFMLIVLAFVGKSVAAVVVLLTLSLGFNGTVTSSTLSAPQDIAPNFAGTIFGLMNGCAMFSGIINPYFIKIFVGDIKTFERWSHYYFCCAAIYIVCGSAYILFGSSELQEWNQPKPKTEEAK